MSPSLIFSDMRESLGVRRTDPLRAELERSEVNPQFVGIVPPSDVAVVTPFEVEMDEAHGRITLPVRTRRSSRSAPSSMPASRQSGLKSIRAGCGVLYNSSRAFEVEMSVGVRLLPRSRCAPLLGLQVGDIISP